MSALNILHDCRTVQLTKGYNALIDEDSLELLGKLKWKARCNGYTVYALQTTYTPRGQGTRMWGLRAMHRVIMGEPEGMVVDHRDGDGRNNTRENLRIATGTQNKQNRRKTRGTSRFKGVSLRANGLWGADIRVNTKRIHLGSFTDEREAARIYDAKAVELFGEFACTNAELFGDDLNQN